MVVGNRNADPLSRQCCYYFQAPRMNVVIPRPTDRWEFNSTFLLSHFHVVAFFNHEFVIARGNFAVVSS